MTRLPFAIEDLSAEIRKVCGEGAEIAISLNEPDWDKVISELRNHGDFWKIGDADAHFKGITLVKLEGEDVRPAA